MKIYIASDHAGFDQKKIIIEFLNDRGYDVMDMGPKNYEPEDDYPDYIFPCAERVSKEESSFGVILGKSGQGEAIVANRVRGVRACVLTSENMDIIQLAREHNNANILSIGSGFVNIDFAKEAIITFLNTEFSNEERHIRRINKIDKN